MHRSGTSAIARVINLLGADLPRELVPPAKHDNERGFWEPLRIVEAQDEFLKSIGSSVVDVSTIPQASLHSVRARAFERLLVELLEQEYGESLLFVVKDPRICRLVPLWLNALRAFKAEPRFLLSVRNPLEVAASLHARNNMSMTTSLLLWLRYVLDAERDTRQSPRAFVPFERLLRDWRGTVARVATELDLEWPRAGHEVNLEVERFLSSQLRHHRFDSSELQARADVVEWVKEAYSAVISAEREPLHVLDRIRHEIDRADLAYGPVIASLRRAHSDAEGAREQQALARHEAEQALAERTGQAEALKEELSRLLETEESRDREVAQLCEMRDSLASEVDELKTEAVRLGAALETAQQALAAADNAAASSSVEVENLQRARQHLVDELERLGGALREGENQLNERELRLQDLEERLGSTTQELQDAQANVSRVSDELRHAHAEVAAANRELSTTTAALDVERRERERLGGELNHTIAEFNEGERKSAVLAEQLAETAQALAARDTAAGVAQTERARLEQMLRAAEQRAAADEAVVSELRSELEELSGELARLESAQERAEAEVEATKRRLDAEMAQSSTNEERARHEIERLQSQVEQLERGVSEAKRLHDSQRVELAASEVAHSEAMFRLEEITAALGERENELERIKVERRRLADALRARTVEVTRLGRALSHQGRGEAPTSSPSEDEVRPEGRDAARDSSSADTAVDEPSTPEDDLASEFAAQPDTESDSTAEERRKRPPDAARESRITDAPSEQRPADLQSSRSEPQAAPSSSDEELIAKCFDSEFYLATYPDIGEFGAMNPLTHFLRYGASEERNPNPHFSTREYIALHSDLEGRNPLVHAVTRGWSPPVRVDDLDALGELIAPIPETTGLLVVDGEASIAARLKRADARSFLLDRPGPAARLAALRASGAGFLVVPARYAWRLDRAPSLRRYLSRQFDAAAIDEAVGIVYALQSPGPRWSSAINDLIALHTLRRRTTTVVDWESGLPLEDVLEDARVIPAKGVDLPFVDGGVDVVVLAEQDPRRLAEARRVAALGVFLRTASDGELANVTVDGSQPAGGRVSVVVAAHEDPDCLAVCLRALAETLPRSPWDVDVVIASKDGAQPILVDLCRRELVDFDHQLVDATGCSAVGAYELGGEHARGDTIVFVDSRVLPLSGWLTPMVSSLQADEKVGAVGGHLIFPSGVLAEAGSVVREGRLLPQGRWMPSDDPRFAHRRPADSFSGFFATSRSAFYSRPPMTDEPRTDTPLAALSLRIGHLSDLAALLTPESEAVLLDHFAG
jgi:hypothetical protein